jgi:hypothetical protein
MLGLDQNGSFLIAAILISVLVLAGYSWYLSSRLRGLRRRAAAEAADQSARNVSAAPPMPTTAQAASSANGPSTS